MAGLRAAQRLSWLVAGALGPSQTGMGQVNWRICISCVKLRLIEPRRSPGMMIAAVETLETGRVCATVSVAKWTTVSLKLRGSGSTDPAGAASTCVLRAAAMANT